MSGWSQIEVAGKTCDLYEPPQRNAAGYVVLYLHGVHLVRLVDNDAVTGELARRGLPVLAPHVARSWWTNRVCEEFDPQLTAERHVLDNIVPFVKERWGTAPPGLALLGTSMGGQGGLRLALRHPRVFPTVAAISPAIDYYRRYYDEDEETLPGMYADPEAARQDTALLHVHALNWPRNIWFCCDPADEKWYDSSQKLQMKLYSLGIPHVCDLETTGGGHSWNYYNRMLPAAIAFLWERLEQEGRRLPT